MGRIGDGRAAYVLQCEGKGALSFAAARPFFLILPFFALLNRCVHIDSNYRSAIGLSKCNSCYRVDKYPIVVSCRLYISIDPIAMARCQPDTANWRLNISATHGNGWNGRRKGRIPSVKKHRNPGAQIFIFAVPVTVPVLNFDGARCRCFYGARKITVLTVKRWRCRAPFQL